MSDRTRDMTQGKPLHLILAFSLPLMLGNIFQQVYGITDAIIVGQFAGQHAFAAFGAADWFNWMVLSSVSGFSHGFSILIAQRYGSGDMQAFRKSVSMSVYLGAVIGVILTLLSLLGVKPILALMNTPSEIVALSETYLYIIFAGISITMAYNVAASILRALGDSKTPLYAMLVASVINILLDLLFIVVFKWSLGGAAIATVIAQVFATAFCFHAIRRISILRLSKEDWKTDGETIARLFRLGTPLALQNAIISIGGMGVQTVVNGFGTLYVAGFTATNKMYGLLEVAATSYGYAVATYTGQNLGAKRIDRIASGLRVSAIIAFLTSLLISVAMFAFGENMLGLFISSSEVAAPQILAIAKRYLFTMSGLLFILYFLHVYRSALQGMGDTVMPMVSGIAELVMRISIAWILPIFIGESGIYYVEIAAWCGAVAILIPAYYIRMRKLV